MSTQFTISGTVIEQGTEKRLNGATIKMKTPSQVLSTVTDKYGRFTFSSVAESDVSGEQETFDIFLSAYYKDGNQQEPQPYKIIIKKGTEPEDVNIKMVNRGPISNSAGRIFLGFLIILLSVLVFEYYEIHNTKANQKQGEVNNKIVNSLTEGLVDRITADSIKVSAFQLKNDSISTLDYEFITAELYQIKDGAIELFKASKIDSTYQALINRNLEDVGLAVNRRNKEEIQAALVNSKTYIKEVPNFKSTWFWQTIPWSYYEIILWALFATLLRLIGNTSFYVSRNIFYRDSIADKMALLFTIPIIALLITFVISFFKISISIAGTALVVDFSNPFVSIILASLIGLAPWRAWEFIYGLADLLFDSLKKWLGLSKSGDAKSEGNEKSPNTDQQNGADQGASNVQMESDPPNKPVVSNGPKPEQDIQETTIQTSRQGEPKKLTNPKPEQDKPETPAKPEDQ